MAQAAGLPAEGAKSLLTLQRNARARCCVKQTRQMNDCPDDDCPDDDDPDLLEEAAPEKGLRRKRLV